MFLLNSTRGLKTSHSFTGAYLYNLSGNKLNRGQVSLFVYNLSGNKPISASDHILITVTTKRLLLTSVMCAERQANIGGGVHPNYYFVTTCCCLCWWLLLVDMTANHVQHDIRTMSRWDTVEKGTTDREKGTFLYLRFSVSHVQIEIQTVHEQIRRNETNCQNLTLPNGKNFYWIRARAVNYT